MIESMLHNRPAWIQLGLALAHFLWQGAVIALVLASALWLMRRRSPNARYALCGMAMLLMAACPIATLWYVRTHPLPVLAMLQESAPHATNETTHQPANAITLLNSHQHQPFSRGRKGSALPATPLHTETTDDKPNTTQSVPSESAIAISHATPQTDPPAQSAPTPRKGLPLRGVWFARGLACATFAWSIGVLFLSLRLITGWWRLRRISKHDAEDFPASIDALARRLADHLEINKRLRLIASRTWQQPAAFGLLKPVVIFPIALLTHCPPELIEAMIAHELAHIRRHDLWINLLQRVIETLLFYHPAVWWVSGRMRLERELCCDDLAIRVTGRRADYASALIELCRIQPALLTPAMAAGIFGPKLSLLTRVRRVLQVSPAACEPNRGRFWLAGPLSIVLAIALVCAACLQSNEPNAASVSTRTGVAMNGTITRMDGTGFWAAESASQSDYIGTLGAGQSVQLLDSKVARNANDVPIVKISTPVATWYGGSNKKTAWVHLADTSFSNNYDPATDSINPSSDAERTLADGRPRASITAPMTYLFGSNIGFTPKLLLGALLEDTEIALLDDHVRQDAQSRPIIKIQTLSDSNVVGAGKVGWVPLEDTSVAGKLADAKAGAPTPFLINHQEATTATRPSTSTARVIANLPDGGLVELIGVTRNQFQHKPRPWWTPTGSPLDREPYAWPGISSNESIPYEFAIRVPKDSTCIARRADQPAVETYIPRDAERKPLPDLRAFVIPYYLESQEDTTVQVSVANGEWEDVESWEFAPWQPSDPDGAIDSKSGVVLRWPREENGSIRVELTHVYVNDATRLIAVDNQGVPHSPREEPRGKGYGVASRACYFSALSLKDLKRLAFQRRPYSVRVTFENVSLKSGHKTDVNVVTSQIAPRTGSSPDGTSQPAALAPPSLRAIQPGDHLRIRMQGLAPRDDFSQSVDEDGNIYIPEIGKISAHGLTTSRLRDQLIKVGKDKKLYGEKLIPDVAVELVPKVEADVAPVRAADTPSGHAVRTTDGSTTLEADRVDLAVSPAAQNVYKVGPSDPAAPEMPQVSIEARYAIVSAEQHEQLKNKYPTPIKLGQNVEGDLLEMPQLENLLAEFKEFKDVPRLIAFDGRQASVRVSDIPNKVEFRPSKLPHLRTAFNQTESIEYDPPLGLVLKVLPTINADPHYVTLVADISHVDWLKDKSEIEEQACANAISMIMSDTDIALLRLPLQRNKVKFQKPKDEKVAATRPWEIIRQSIPAATLPKYLYVLLRPTILPATHAEHRTSTTPSVYRMGPGDVLDIRMLDFLQRDMESTFTPTVDEAGTIAIPQLGDIPVEGLTANQVRDRLVKQSKAAGIYRQDSTPTIIVQTKQKEHRAFGGIPIRSLIDGIIDVTPGVCVKEGQTVKKGDVLVQLLEMHEIALEIQAAQERIAPLRAEYDKLSSPEEKDKRDDRQYQKLVHEMRLFEFDSARCHMRLNRTQINSPADGIVRAAEASLASLPGKRISAGDVLLYVETAQTKSAEQSRANPDMATLNRIISAQQLSQLKEQRALLLQEYGENHPKVRQADQQIAGLEESMKDPNSATTQPGAGTPPPDRRSSQPLESSVALDTMGEQLFQLQGQRMVLLRQFGEDHPKTRQLTVQIAALEQRMVNLLTTQSSSGNHRNAAAPATIRTNVYAVSGPPDAIAHELERIMASYTGPHYEIIKSLPFAKKILVVADPDTLHFIEEFLVKLEKMRHFVRLVVGTNVMTFEGSEVTPEQLSARIAELADPRHTVLEVAVGSKGVTVNSYNEIRALASNLVLRYGLEYLNDVGEHPLGSKGAPDQLLPSTTTQPAQSNLNIRIFAIKYAKATKVADTCRNLFKGESNGGHITIDATTNSVIVRATESDVNRIAELIAQLDVEPTPAQATHEERILRAFHLKHAKAADVAKTITAFFPPEQVHQISDSVTAQDGGDNSNTLLLSYSSSRENLILALIEKLDRDPPDYSGAKRLVNDSPPTTQPAHTGSAPPAPGWLSFFVPATQARGDEVEGVICRLQPCKRSYVVDAPEDEPPQMFLHVENRQIRDLYQPTPKFRNENELEVDGRWYRPTQTNSAPVSRRPLKSYGELIDLFGDHWRSTENHEPLNLNPGKHTIRVACTFSTSDSGQGKQIRVVSNPSEIEIVPLRFDVLDPATLSVTAKPAASIQPASTSRPAAISGHSSTIQPANDNVLSEARRLCKTLADREHRSESFRQLFELQGQIGRTVDITDPVYGEGRLTDKWPLGYMHDSASGISIVNTHAAFAMHIAETINLPCWFLFDRDGRLLHVRANETAVAMIDANRDGTVKILTAQEYAPPLPQNELQHIRRVYWLHQSQLDLEMTIRMDFDHVLHFGDAQGSLFATLEVVYGGETRSQYVYTWDPKAHVYTGRRGSPLMPFEVLGDSKFTVEAGHREYGSTAKEFPGEFHPEGRPLNEADPDRLTRRLMALWYNPSLAETIVDDVTTILDEKYGQNPPTIASALLGHMHYRKALPQLSAMAMDANRWHGTRAVAIWAVSRIDAKGLRGDLEKLARSDSQSGCVRIAAIRALAVLAHDAATVAAESALPGPENRRAELAAMAWWTRTTGQKLGQLRVESEQRIAATQPARASLVTIRTRNGKVRAETGQGTLEGTVITINGATFDTHNDKVRVKAQQDGRLIELEADTIQFDAEGRLHVMSPGRLTSDAQRRLERLRKNQALVEGLKQAAADESSIHVITSPSQSVSASQPAADDSNRRAPKQPSTQPASSSNSRPKDDWIVEAVVRDGAGQPFEGVTVKVATGIATLLGGDSATTDKDGKCTVHFGPRIRFHSETGDYVGVQAAKVFALKAGWHEKNLCRAGDLDMALHLPETNESNVKPEQIILPNKPRHLEFTMLPTATLHGRIVDPGGKPVAHQRVSISGTELPPATNALDDADTDADGRFTINSVPCRSWWATVRGKGDRWRTEAKSEPFEFREPRDYHLEYKLEDVPGKPFRLILSKTQPAQETRGKDSETSATQPARLGADATTVNKGVFYVAGNVARPGVYTLPPQAMMLRHVVAAAGGLDKKPLFAPKATCRIERHLPDNNTAIRRVDLAAILDGLAPDVQIERDDVLHIAYDGKPATDWQKQLPPAQPTTGPAVFYMMGHVARPGVYNIDRGQVQTLRRAIAAVGGIEPALSSKKHTCQITRRERHGKDVIEDTFPIDIDAIMSGKQVDIDLQADDVVNIR